MTRFRLAAPVVFAAALGTAAQNPAQPQPKQQPWWGGPALPPLPQPPAWWAGIPRPQPQAQPQWWWGGIQLPQPVYSFARPSVTLRGLEREPPLYGGPLVRVWASRAGAELEQLKLDLAAAKLAPAAHKAIADRADVAIRAADALEQSIAERDRREWPRFEAGFRAAVDDLTRAVAQVAATAPALRLPMSRVRYAAEQATVGVILTTERTPAQMQELVKRLAAGLAEQAERLHEAVAAAVPALERDARQFSRATAKFAADLQTATDFARVRNDLVALGGEWDGVALALGGAAQLPPAVQFQATRVDGLYRKLTEVFEVVPPPPARPLPPQPRRMSVLAVGAGDGMPPRLVVYADDKGTVAHAFDAYHRGAFKSGVRVAVADLNGDGLPEVVTVPGGGGPARVWVFDGRDMSPTVRIDTFGGKEYAYGHTVAAADLTRDGRALIAVAPDTGGPGLVEVYDLAAGRLLGTVSAFGREFVGGVRLAWGDVNGDGAPDLVTATGPGQVGTEVKIFDGRDFTTVLREFHVLDAKFQGGAWVAAADLSRSNRAEIVVGLDAGSRPVVRVFEGATGKLLGEAEPYPANFRGGVRVAIGDPSDREQMKVIAAPGAGGRDLPIKVIRPDGKVVSELDPFPKSNRGMFVGSR